ncbi:hypothetical protein RJD11_11925 [Bacillus velezensis]|uniref:transposase zinc-binding domain-containing protein n=1 Tax=Bacillus TaxID=1386 RepID=UPI001C52EC03|nr:MULTISPECIES: transposase zinc-binding domain-containing protein [Bacillus amyloliquefaciens group]QXP95475.1 transposase zinc-binding domain-containing protein [Bacillus velezensis]QXP99270.1 transposase zinc-binding domain-containing protein [Bacillus velezensis]UHH01302.1 transposase zinc-binding domain-containing protein [Bacillus amyloliquefaciens]ULR21050.1 transposase zinc-binding domain-containing protein [Bacillus velezensis]UVW07793.1 transposase zinc-binding domain-containing pro
MEYKTITVTKPRFGIGRILCLLAGLFLLAIALLVSLTIIGIFAGAVLLILSLPFFAAAKGGARYTCPNCGYEKNGVANGKVNASCKRCRQNIAVNWIDKSTKNSESLS